MTRDFARKMTGSPRLLTMAALVISGLFVTATERAEATGAFDLLRIDPTPRGAALGSFPIALADGDPGSLAIHPAGLASLETRSLSASYADHPLDLAGGRFAFGAPVLDGYGAVSVDYFSYGAFDARQTLIDDPTGTFIPTDILASAGYARNVWGGVNAGAALRFLHSEIDEFSSNAVSVDLSAHWNTGWKKVQVAAAIMNAGTQLDSYIDTKEDLPLTGRFGLAKQLEHLPLILSGTGHYELDGGFAATFAGEFTVSDLLKLRAGYTTRASDYHVGGSLDGLAGLSAGLGLTHRDLRLDYAFNSQGAVGQVHRFGVGWAF